MTYQPQRASLVQPSPVRACLRSFFCIHKFWIDEGLVNSLSHTHTRTQTHLTAQNTPECNACVMREIIFPSRGFSSWLDLNKKMEAEISPKTCWQFCVPSWLNYSSRTIKHDLEVLLYQKRFWLYVL